ncbi:MAG: hypothetical protein JXR52_00360 [Bacteroidales bacterium]|nr:hypothetical protein [Bacteroidales bacterium]MBN2697246.1 hypothetical protein [Bacteroidales bacterium]
MKKEVILIFDIGKTNKKLLLFDMTFRVLHQEETRFDEVTDDDGFACDDGDRLERWIDDSLQVYLEHPAYDVMSINFTTYGATLVYVNDEGKRITPIYNYLKPMPGGVLEGFYERYGGIDEFSRRTASPAMGMLNSGLQALWLKRKKPETFRKVSHIMHLPQYLSYRLTGFVSSEHTSIGCHTALWDFDRMRYHPWVGEESVHLPEPIDVSSTFPVKIGGKTIRAGIGIHDSSASLAPYIMNSREPFILLSTGTWCISMNPFNHTPLTAEQLKQDCLCYMSVSMKPVKSSRVFLGHIHDVNVKVLADYFKVGEDDYKKVKPDPDLLQRLTEQHHGQSMFFPEGVPESYLNRGIDLKKFASFGEAYHQLMMDLTKLVITAIELIIPENDSTGCIYITGGFARNEIFTRLLASAFTKKRVFTSEVDNATSLGAAMVVAGERPKGTAFSFDLGLKPVVPF